MIKDKLVIRENFLYIINNKAFLKLPIVIKTVILQEIY
jgi:hypothetical protein